VFIRVDSGLYVVVVVPLVVATRLEKIFRKIQSQTPGSTYTDTTIQSQTPGSTHTDTTIQSQTPGSSKEEDHVLSKDSLETNAVATSKSNFIIALSCFDMLFK
jgi:hypothetical protein